MKKLILFVLLALAPAYAQAQVVGQGSAGTDPWLIAGTVATVSAISATGTLSSTSCPGTGCVSITLTGQSGVGFYFADSSFVGSIAAEVSMNGTTWSETDLYLALSATAYNRLSRLSSPGLSSNFVITTVPGTTNVRLRVISYTSGSAAITLSATALPFIPPSSVGAQDSSVQGIGLVGGRYASISGTLMPAVVTDSPAASNGMGLIVRDPQIAVATGGGANTTGAQIMVKDATSGVMAPATSLSTAPAGTESGQIVRNIPSGTQAISAASLPLPAGAATSAKQDSLLTELQLKADLTETQPVSAASLPLPAGAATSAKQDTLLTELQLKADLTETQPVSVASLPLPAGAATSANQTTTNASLSSIDGKLTAPLSTVSKVVLTANSPATASVGVASASALAANASRKGLIIVNVSTAKVCLGIGSAAVIDNGICLQPDAAWSMNEYSFATGAINAIASAAASSISIQEFQ